MVKNWTTKKVHEIAAFRNGKPYEHHLDANGKYELISLNSIDINGKLKSKHHKLNINDSSLIKNDIVMILSDVAHGNFLGLTDVIKENDRYVLNYRIGGLRIQNKNVHPQYLRYFFNANQYRFKILGQGSSQLNLTKDDILNFEVAYPTLTEQKAIATALSDVDDLIANLDKLITKKKAIKQGAMQQLLTPPHKGGKRLAGFSGEWVKKSIGELTRNIIDYRGVTPKKLGMDWGNGDIVALSAGNVKKGFIDYESECYYGSNALYKRWMRNGDVQKNDIVFTLEAPLGNVAIIPDNKKYILSQRTILLQLDGDKYSSPLVFQILMSEKFQSYISSSATGSTAQGIKRTTFEKLFVEIPESIKEQNTIAQILSDMDKEIEQLETKKAKYQDIKQGMMQELLTGKTRLI